MGNWLFKPTQIIEVGNNRGIQRSQRFNKKGRNKDRLQIRPEKKRGQTHGQTHDQTHGLLAGLRPVATPLHWKTRLPTTGGAKIRKHKGIYQSGKHIGKIKPGYKYSGKNTTTGLKSIIKK